MTHLRSRSVGRPALFLPAFVTALVTGPAALAAGHPELGTVRWGRSLPAAQRLAEKTKKPLLILFDEVPGCQTCVRYGQAVLSDPLIAEAIEAHFVPVAIFNNRGGADRAALERFEEPSWNNPVVRIVDHDMSALAPRVAGDYQKRGIVLAMKAALRRAGRPVPGYLEVLARELRAPRAPSAFYSMYCFWTGEVCLAGLPGVVSTRPGFAEGEEVVEVRYDPKITDREALDAAARACGRPLQTLRFSFSAKDDKYQLRGRALAKVPMTRLQRALVNRAVAKGGRLQDILSPRQLEAARRR